MGLTGFNARRRLEHAVAKNQPNQPIPEMGEAQDTKQTMYKAPLKKPYQLMQMGKPALIEYAATIGLILNEETDKKQIIDIIVDRMAEMSEK